jgi:hypothetical protein
VEIAGELRALAARVPADGAPPASLAPQRAADAAEAVAAALGTDPTLAERQQRNLDLLYELLRRLAPLARQAAAELERQRLAAAGADTAHLGRRNPLAPEELDAVSGRCPVIAARIAAAVLPDWDSPRRVRELSASRLPRAHELAEIADRLRRAVAPALDLPHPAPEAVRLAALAELIAPRAAGGRRCAGPGCDRELEAAPTGRRRFYCGPACRQRARRSRLELAGTAGDPSCPPALI